MNSTLRSELSAWLEIQTLNSKVESRGPADTWVTWKAPCGDRYTNAIHNSICVGCIRSEKTVCLPMSGGLACGSHGEPDAVERLESHRLGFKWPAISTKSLQNLKLHSESDWELISPLLNSNRFASQLAKRLTNLANRSEEPSRRPTDVFSSLHILKRCNFRSFLGESGRLSGQSPKLSVKIALFT